MEAARVEELRRWLELQRANVEHELLVLSEQINWALDEVNRELARGRG